MVFQNYQNLIEMTSNIIDIVAFGVGIKCPRKIHLNTQWGGGPLEGFKLPWLQLINFVFFFSKKWQRNVFKLGKVEPP